MYQVGVGIPEITSPFQIGSFLKNKPILGMEIYFVPPLLNSNKFAGKW